MKLDQLTGLRYFAALLVFLSHLQWKGSPDFFVKVFEQGYVGVSFFFMLSGFVLSYSYGKKIVDQKISQKKYMLLRLARLTPLHFATAAPFVFLSIYKSDFNFLKTGLNLMYLQSWVPSSSFYFSLNAPSWSLSDEMFFYFCFFSLAFCSSKRLMTICFVLLAIVFAFAGLFSLYLSGAKIYGSQTLAHWLFYIFPGFRLVEFLVGMLFYRLWNTGFRLNSRLIIPSYILLVGAMYFAESVPEAFRYSMYYLPIIGLFFYAHLNQSGVVVRFYSTKPLVLLGNASFAFYLIHQPLIPYVNKAIGSFDLSNGLFFLIAMVFISTISIFVYLLYERKMEFYLKSVVSKAVH